MANVFGDVVAGLKWLGKEIITPFKAIDHIVTVSEDVKADAETLLPEITTLFADADALVVSSVKDGGAALGAVEKLTTAVIQAVSDAKAINITGEIKDVPEVSAAFTALVAEITSKSTWSDVLANLAKFIADYDALATSAKASLAKLEADV